MLSRDDERVSRRLGIDVSNRDPIRFIRHQLRVNDAVDDLAEQAIAHLVTILSPTPVVSDSEATLDGGSWT